MRINVGLLVLFFAASLAGCTAQLWVDAKIVDTTGKPITDAELKLDRPLFDMPYSRRPSVNGCLRTGGPVSPSSDTWDITVSAPGYKPVFMRVHSPDEHVLIFTLAPENTGEQSRVQAVSQLPCEVTARRQSPAVQEAVDAMDRAPAEWTEAATLATSDVVTLP